MNQGIYRLVWSAAAGAWRAAPESARGHGKDGRRQPRTARRAGGLALLLAGVQAFAAPPLPSGTLPVPSTSVARPFVSSGAATQAAAGNTLTVNQTSQKVTLNWDSFNIARDSAVVFNQPGASAAALNRIWSNDPSVIQGRLTANGQVYLINQNGILFDRGAQVNVGGLVASALDIKDDVFERGFLSLTNGDPAFAFGGDAAGFAASLVRVENGAEIRTADGGRVMLFAPRVENAGRIETPSGQAMLAAGAKVYLAASDNPNLRGILVEVDPFVGTDEAGNAVNLGGTVTNERNGEQIGEIIARRGNITLAALAVNQQGRLTATTGVAGNGSIRIQARDTTVARNEGGSAVYSRYATRGGTATLGEGSVTEVLPETGTEEASLDAQVFYPSEVLVEGAMIHLKRDAAIIAPGGNVTLNAAIDPSQSKVREAGAPATESRILLEAGARVDVSGSRDVAVAMERNSVEAELRGAELADSPLQRSGILYGEKVYFDLRSGTKLADVSAYSAQVKRSTLERTAVGGTALFQSEGDVVVMDGATVDVSGGSLKYADGWVQTTQLVSQGRVFGIADAAPDRIYDAAFTTRRFDSGYVEGKNAGRAEFVARAVALDGKLTGSVVAGAYQREAGKRPLGGELVVGDSTGGRSSVPDYRLPGVTIALERSALDAAFLADPLNAPLGTRGDTTTLSTRQLAEGGFDRLSVYANGSIVQRADAVLAVGPGGSVKLAGRSVELNADIVAPGGSISLTSANTLGTGSEHATDIRVADGVRLDASGTWTNDWSLLSRGNATGAVTTKGGSIKLSSITGITLGSDSLLDVSGGGWLKANDKLAAGDAGSISLAVNAGQLADFSSRLSLGGELRGYALGKGGKLAINVGKLRIGGNADLDEHGLDADFFQRGGFADYALTGVRGVTIAAGTVVVPQRESLVLAPGYRGKVTGTSIAEATQRTVLPAERRDPTHLALAATHRLDGALNLERGARIVSDIGARVALSAATDMRIEGGISAPAGTIALTLTDTAGAADDPGFRPEQAIWLTRDAALSVAGAARIVTDARGVRSGEVYGGGEIEITANKGYILGEEGASLDAGGTHAVLDLPGTAGVQATDVASDGGTIRLTAREGIYSDASLSAAAGGTSAAGGRFELRLDRDGIIDVSGVPTPYPTTERQVVVAENGKALPAGLAPGDPVAAGDNGKARVSAQALGAAGFDDIKLESEDRIVFEGNVQLGARRSVTLEAPVIAAGDGAAAQVSAYHVAVSNADPLKQTQQTSSGGNASLAVSAQLIDFAGHVGLQGFSQAGFASTGDIRLSGLLAGQLGANTLTGSLAGSGGLTFTAAQVYPTTLSEFRIVAQGSGSQVVFAGGTDATVPMSAGGKLTVEADRIVQGGTLRAPLGQIALNAGSSLELKSGSVTSVSGEGQLIPFGMIDGGLQWVYDLDGVQRVMDAPIEKTVRLAGDSVEIKAGALVDLSGGGELYAYEWIPGLGGSKDVLRQPGMYAILPGYQSSFAPRDYQYAAGSDLKVGDQITLGAGSGLPAGTYTLLPARYALLPGAYAVSRMSGYTDMQAGSTVALRDGSAIVAGHIASAAGSREARDSGFLVTSRETIRAQSEYSDAYGGSFFSAKAGREDKTVPRLAADAGRLIAAATSSLVMDGRLDFGTVDGGRGGQLDIDSVRIAVLASGGSASPGFLALDAATLNATGAHSIVLGGVREPEGGATRLNVGASEVTIDNAGTALVAADLVVVAKDRVKVDAGSVLRATGASSDGYDDLLLSGDGALVRVANGGTTTRTGAVGVTGTAEIAAGAQLSGAVVVLDGTYDTRLEATTRLDAESVTLGASRIALGVDSASQGLAVGSQLLGQLGGASSIALRSYQGIDLHGSLAVGGTTDNGTPTLRELTLDTPGLAGLGAAGDTVAFTAGKVRFVNTTGNTYGGSPTGAGTLSIAAVRSPGNSGDVVFGEGNKQIAGFAKTSVTADGDVRIAGTGSLAVSGDLDLASARIAADTRARQEVVASGAVRIAARGSAPTTAASGLGGELSIIGRSVEQAGRIELPAGKVLLQATAADVVLAAGSSTRATGVAKSFDGVTRYADGGEIRLRADQGDVRVDTGAEVDVGAPAADGTGGTLALEATQGQVQVDGTISGRNGSMSLDAGSASGLEQTLLRVAAGGFETAQSFRLRSGNVSLPAGVSVAAREVSVAVDGGSLSVSGEVNAGAADGGTVRLYARDDVTIAAGGRVMASANAAGGMGGRVELGTVDGAIRLAAGSRVAVGGQGGRDGEVLLRAPRTASNNDVAVTALDGAIDGARSVAIEAVKRYDGIATISTGTSSGSKLGMTTVANDSTSFMANAAAIAGRLGRTDDASFHVRPGVEVRAPGNLALSADWNLYSASRSGGEPGVLTLRAGGNLDLDRKLSDGFNGVATSSALGTGESWSYRLVAGADAAAADPLAVQGAAGDVTVGASAFVRTGTGRIEIAAAHDVKLASSASVIYTSGRPSDALAGFTPPSGSNFSQDGGDIAIAAGNDVVGVASPYLINNWLWRQGKLNSNGTFNKQTAWWPVFDRFKQGIGALGGGNVSVRAGRNLQDVSVMMPTQGRMSGTTPDMANLVVTGGGNMRVAAGGDILGGQFYLGAGMGIIKAGGGMGQGGVGVAGKPALHTILALGDARLDVRTRDELNLGTAFNPTVFSQQASNYGSIAFNKAFFFTYGVGAGLGLASLTGDVVIHSEADNIKKVVEAAPASEKLAVNPSTGEIAGLTVYPGSVKATAFSGDIEIKGKLALYPTSRGELELLAAGSVRTSGSVRMADVEPGDLVQPDRPSFVFSNSNTLINGYPGNPLTHAATPLHEGDPNPVRIVAEQGSIVGIGFYDGVFPKPARLVAGKDIENFDFYGQNIAASDTTTLIAGRDIRFVDPGDNSTTQSRIELGGPGTLEITAGRHVDLGKSEGIVTRGNLSNSALAQEGAAIRVTAGAKPSLDLEVFVASYLAGDSAANLDALIAYMGALDPTTIWTRESALTAFRALPQDSQLPFALERVTQVYRGEYLSSDKEYAQAWTDYLARTGGNPDHPAEAQLLEFGRHQLLWGELRASGRAAVSDGATPGDYSRGYAAIEAVGLGAPFKYAGNLNLYFSQIKSERGGAIDLIVPGGLVNAGLAVPPSNLDKTPDRLGIMTVKGGDINALVRDDFQVNQSRVFTLEGGSILLWSSAGNIDAGRGAKTAVAAPPPIIKTDPKTATQIVEFPGAATGSGIGVLLTKPGLPPGDVDLFAPKGEVNAGDAGIRSSGRVTIAAQRVVGADNIQAGGSVSGVAMAGTSSSSPAAPASPVGDSGKAATQSLDNLSSPGVGQQNSLFTVEVIGLGDEEDERKKRN